MHRSHTTAYLLGIMLGLISTIRTQQDPVKKSRRNDLVSGPASGTALPSVKVYVQSGGDAGKEVDLATRFKKGVSALLFIHVFDRNSAPVIRGLDRLARDFSILGFQYRPIMLTGDRTAGESQLKRVNRGMRLLNPIVLSLDGLDGPGGFGLNRNCVLTLVLSKNGRVVRSVGYTDTNTQDLTEVRKWIQELTGPIPRGPELAKLVHASLPKGDEDLREYTVKLLLRIRQLERQVENLRNNRGRNNRQRNQRRMNRPGRNQRRDAGRGGERRGGAEQAMRPKKEGKVPSDAKLVAYLRQFIRKTHDEKRIGEILDQIEERIGSSDDLRVQAMDMFKHILSFGDNYGSNYARKRAKAYVEKHEKRAKARK